MSRDLHPDPTQWYSCQYPERPGGAFDSQCHRCLIAFHALVARNGAARIDWRVDGGAEPMSATEAARRLSERAAS